MAEHTREELEDRKVDELRDLASAADVEGYSSMRKAELIDALLGESRRATDNIVEAPDLTDTELEEIRKAEAALEAGTVDPAIVERRDATRKAQADRPGRVRPTPASIDPRLVERREATRAQGRTEQPATAPPTRG